MGFIVGVLILVTIGAMVHMMSKSAQAKVSEPELEHADGFVVTQEVMGLDNVSGIAVDERQKKLRLISYHRAGAFGIDQGGAFGSEEGLGFGPDQDRVRSVHLDYADILSAQVLDDFALSGDRIACATMRLQLRITLKNTSIPTYSLVFLESPFRANSTLHDAALHSARHWLGVLEAAIHEGERLAAPSPVAESPAPVSMPSMADELRKLAQLRDEGLLTEPEFQQQKARLLA